MPEHADRSRPDDPHDTLTEKDREIERLRRELERVERERDRLRRENDRLKQQLDAARREGKRQAAPFSKGAPAARPRRRGRRPGAAYGRRAHRPIPTHIDERHDVPLPPSCPHCGGHTRATRVAVQYQEDLPVVRPRVRRFDIQVGCCTNCHRRVQGRHPLQTSDALGAAAAQLGPHAVALAVILNKQLGVPLAKITTLFHDRFGLSVTPGGLVHALHRAAHQARPSYEALCARIRGSPMVVPDETGWKVDGRLQWLWTFASRDTTVYAIQPGRGFPQAAAVLGADYDGVLVHDGWAPYRHFTHAAHQSCVAHLLRRCRTLHGDHPRAAFAPQVEQILQRALALRDRRDDRAISVHGTAVARGRLIRQLLDTLDRPGRLPAMARFAAHLSVELPGIFTFLFAPDVDATNWRAEQALRPAVVTRKVCGGNRSPLGAETQQILASVVRTARQRDLDVTDVFVTLLRAPQPTIPFALQTLAAVGSTR